MGPIAKLVVVLALAGLSLAQEAPKTPDRAAEAATVPSIDAGIGQCTADFRVVGMEDKPLYNAKIAVQIKWGFGGFRKTDLEIGTNAEGKARFTGLPERARRPMAFNVSFEGRKTVVLVDPEQNCHGNYAAMLAGAQQKPAPGK